LKYVNGKAAPPMPEARPASNITWQKKKKSEKPMESMTKKGACVCWYKVPRHGRFTSDYMAIPLFYQLVLQAKGTLHLKTRETRNHKCRASFSG
jgi:hypothetical protein